MQTLASEQSLGPQGVPSSTGTDPQPVPGLQIGASQSEAGGGHESEPSM